MSITIPSQSVWPLDGRYNFSNTVPTTGSSLGEGLLQNNYSFLTGSGLSNFTSSISYFYKHTLQSKASIKSKSGLQSIQEPTQQLSTDLLFNNSANWDVPDQIGKGPYYDSYDQWLETARYATKNFTILPEYKISEAAIRAYNDATLNLQEGDEYFLSLTGAYFSSSIEQGFYEKYAHSDNNEKLLQVINQLPNSSGKIDININALIKFNPYEGFYPVERTIQLASLFSSSFANQFDYSKNRVTVTSSIEKKALLGKAIQPFYSPGIMYNTIKAGIAVDYPLISSSFSYNAIPRFYSGVDEKNYVITKNRFDYRLPFEAIINPEAYYDSAVDMNPNPSGNFGYTASFIDVRGNQSYSNAVSNFLGEVENFFVSKDRIVITPNTIGRTGFVGGEAAVKININNNKLGKQYSALVQLYKTKGSTANPSPVRLRFTTSSAETPQSFDEETITMYSLPSAFGPPCGGGHNNNNVSGVIDSCNGYNAPFTPPYYDGAAWAFIDFTPQYAGTYTMSEIINSSSITYLRYEFNSASISDGFGYYYKDSSDITKNEPHGWANINENAMQLDSSVRIYEYNGSLIIESKFETPILNFDPDYTNNTPSITLTNDIPTDSVIPRGMWHQYGKKPASDEGIYIKISDIPNSYKKFGSRSSYRVTGTVYANPTLTGSLLTDIFRFDGKQKIKLGNVKQQKEISEAIVALPFVIKNNKREFFTVPLHYQVPRELIKFDNGNGSWASDETKKNFEICSSLIRKQENLMKRWALPPHLDWINYDIPKYLMFFAELSENLSESDLIDIWQNTLPRIGTEQNWKIKNIKIEDIPIQLFNDAQPQYLSEPIYETTNVEVSSDSETTFRTNKEVFVGTTETQYIIGDSALIDTTMLNKVDNLQWLFFKVKKLSKSFYSNVDTQRQNTTGAGGAGGAPVLEQINLHNWPYDYFSLIESAEIKIKYKN